MALDLEKLVPNGYFRTYWVQQNITDLSQYSAAVSDLFRSNDRYREERVLIRKKAAENYRHQAGASAAAELSRLVPDDAGVYVASANPTAAACFAMLETKLLAPHFGPCASFAVRAASATYFWRAGRRIRPGDAYRSTPGGANSSAVCLPQLQDLLNQTPILASLQLESTDRDKAGVFVQIHSAVVLDGGVRLERNRVHSAIADFIRPSFTASHLGVGWQQKSGYQELDGLWPLRVSVRGKYLL